MRYVGRLIRHEVQQEVGYRYKIKRLREPSKVKNSEVLLNVLGSKVCPGVGTCLPTLLWHAEELNHAPDDVSCRGSLRG